MTVPLTAAEFAAVFSRFHTSAFRLELQQAYLEPSEAATFARWQAGDPQPPIEVPDLADWYNQIQVHTAAGRTVERVRVQEDPPTDYQRWERWIGAWNTAAGESIRYLTRTRAHEVGLLPAAGDRDWWLFDDAWLVVMTFDTDGRRLTSEIVADSDTVAQARAWRDLAVHHSIPHPVGADA
ncbi:DUF6879 family protein [Catellatospora sp. NPDC049111]|uniref:DUF6879 family protein n=1 Tax=Catellatospora sp. NPDC049111 TaxID=3155271 RepID=UPI0033DC51D1